MMEGGVLCLLVALRPRLELRYQPVTLPKLNVVPTNKFLRLTDLGIIGAFQIEAALQVPSCPTM